MKRNWEIVRDILIKVESNEAGSKPLENRDFPDDLKFEYSEHVEILFEAKLIKGNLFQDLKPPKSYSITGITWEGYELLDAIRNETIWNKTKNLIKDSGTSVGLQLLKEIAIDYSKDLLGGS